MKLYVDVNCPHCKTTERHTMDIDTNQLWEVVTDIGQVRTKCKQCKIMYTVSIVATTKGN